MTFKKSIALLLSGSMLAAAALTGCGSDNTASAVSNTAGKDLLDQIQARGQHHSCHGGYLGPLDLSR